jgi:hypothetical protein
MNKGDGIEIFTQKSNIVHFYKYDYSLVEYINNKTKVKIICKEHGIFEQTPGNHKSGHGCPAQKNIIGKLRFDFYLPKHNTCIEFNGRQHYESVSIYGGQIGLRKQIKNDNIKVEYCRKNNIQLIIIKYDESIYLFYWITIIPQSKTKKSMCNNISITSDR